MAGKKTSKNIERATKELLVARRKHDNIWISKGEGDSEKILDSLKKDSGFGIMEKTLSSAEKKLSKKADDIRQEKLDKALSVVKEKKELLKKALIESGKVDPKIETFAHAVEYDPETKKVIKGRDIEIKVDGVTFATQPEIR